ncbi:cytotoxic translational repressor of toxin-antitoxin stability system [Candidatus Woesearchaeota archaeon]|jgi:mRNA interferase RelE/StbE|nr:cytotoxic translational repressor of toxin-antitoxin stability system [Candidatus Woesearchaeota archaeon]|tara:strand:+ start:2294 stop:2545 length:252 start_codon:yes stop_codon:yes gene_type:complete
MYEVTLSPKAHRQVKKLPKLVAERIVDVLDRAKIRPEQHFERLVGKELYKLRVGDYRIIAEIIHNTLHILVLEIDHRKRIYKR